MPVPPMGPADLCDATRRLFAQVPRGPRVGIACAKGVRSALATAILRQAGYNVFDLGGMRDPVMRLVILSIAA
jgi:rhodanese-related sulfurtransferase